MWRNTHTCPSQEHTPTDAGPTTITLRRHMLAQALRKAPFFSLPVSPLGCTSRVIPVISTYVTGITQDDGDHERVTAVDSIFLFSKKKRRI